MAGRNGDWAGGWLSGACLAATLWVAAPAGAEPVTAKPGPTHLPASGLVIDLPANPAVTYKVSGSWSVDDNAISFDSRDVIDEFDAASGKIVAGNWVMVGYFTAGDCKAVLAAEPLDQSWTTEATLWGEVWSVRGGVYTLSADIGRRPAAMLCKTNELGRSLTLYRYFVDQPETMSRADILGALPGAAVLKSAWNAYSSNSASEIQPLRRPEMRQRGGTPADRLVTLQGSGLQVHMPDDGYVWLPEPNGPYDLVTRLAPAMPEISLEFMEASGASCTDILATVTDEKPGAKARNLPATWATGPTLVVDGETELTVCKDSADGARLVGLFLPDGRTDLTPFHPILIALGNARRP